MPPNEPPPDDDAQDETEPSFDPSWLEVEALRAMYQPDPPPAREEDDDAHAPTAPRPDE